MTEIYEAIQLNGPERNVERLGAMVAWLVSNNLLSIPVERSSGSAAARVRMQDMTGPAFLTTVLHGELKAADINEVAQGFVASYLVTGRYNEDYDRCDYEGENEWLRYDEVSPLISEAYRQFRQPKTIRSTVAKILKFPSRS